MQPRGATRWGGAMGCDSVNDWTFRFLKCVLGVRASKVGSKLCSR